MRIILLFAFYFLSVPYTDAQDHSSMDSVISRYRQFLLRNVDVNVVDSFVPKYISTLNQQKQWPDIDYTDTSSASWKVMAHLGRIETLAIAWNNPHSGFYRNVSLWNTVCQSLDHWLEKRYQNHNWWHNEIGVPRSMLNIIVLLRDGLDDRRFKQAMEVLAQHKVKGVGANMIWSADLGMHYGLLMHDDTMVAKNSQLIAQEIKVSTGEGIQPDYSFHQHENRLQIYHYGSSFLRESVRIAWELRGTKWDFPKEKVKILTDFVLNGWQWMSRGIYIVPGTIDRAASRMNALNYADIRTLIPYLIDLNPAYRSQFQSISNRQNETDNNLTGFRYYPYSDFSAYHQKGFSLFLKTISERTLPSESIISENLKGKLLNNGDAYLIRNGKEYFNLMPVWDWMFLPGQTNADSNLQIKRNEYAGSVSDGQTGASAMIYALEGPQKKLQANKFWASYKNIVICLIGGLTKQNIRDSVFTAMDQCRWQEPVVTNSNKSSLSKSGVFMLPQTQWVYHSQFAYIPLGPSLVKMRVEKRTGTWSSINQSIVAPPVNDSVFMPLLYHDANKRSTGYVLAFCQTQEKVIALVKHQLWKVLSNNDTCQAVVFQNGTVMAAFYASATLHINATKSLTVDKPCMLQIAGKKIYASDPLHKGTEVSVTINKKKYKLFLKTDGTTTAVSL